MQNPLKDLMLQPAAFRDLKVRLLLLCVFGASVALVWWSINRLPASENTLAQQNTKITELENQIADRREFYNDSVNMFNIRIQVMPDTFVASFMNLQPRSMFKVEEADKADVPMTFGAAR